MTIETILNVVLSLLAVFMAIVFHEVAQREFLPKPIFNRLRRTIDGLEPFDAVIADAVAHGVKEWALSHGATHFTHWFVPMTGSTAEKHDAFITYSPDGRAIVSRSRDWLSKRLSGPAEKQRRKRSRGAVGRRRKRRARARTSSR